VNFGRVLTIEIVALDEERGKAIIEISFSGVHDHRWPHRDEILDYLREEMRERKPSAILINFLNYQYSWGNELFGPIFEISWDSENSRTRVCSIIASGKTAESVKNLLTNSNTLGVLDITLFDEKEKALDHLKSRLRPDSGIHAQPPRRHQRCPSHGAGRLPRQNGAR